MWGAGQSQDRQTASLALWNWVEDRWASLKGDEHLEVGVSLIYIPQS
jgi:hypothetical protein